MRSKAGIAGDLPPTEALTDTGELCITLDTVLHPETREEHVAHWISQIGSPPIMGLAGLLLTAFTLSLPGIWLWAGLYLLIGMLLPLGYLFWLVRRGQITDLDIHLREQRNKPFLATILGGATTWIVLRVGGAPRSLTLLAGASLLQTSALFLITQKWKISIHTSTAAGMSVLMWSIAGKAAAPLVISIPIIAWSRVKLHHHTTAQTVAGSALGATVFLTALLLTR